MKKILFILITVASFSTYAQVSNSTVVTNLSAEDFKKLSSSDKNGVIIDLRTNDELASKGFIKGSIQLDWLAKDNEEQVNKLDKSKTYYIYCAAGGRSGECAEYMEKHKFKRVFNLEKGFSSWSSKGFPVEKK